MSKTMAANNWIVSTPTWRQLIARVLWRNRYQWQLRLWFVYIRWLIQVGWPWLAHSAASHIQSSPGNSFTLYGSIAWFMTNKCYSAGGTMELQQAQQHILLAIAKMTNCTSPPLNKLCPHTTPALNLQSWHEQTCPKSLSNQKQVSKIPTRRKHRASLPRSFSAVPVQLWIRNKCAMDPPIYVVSAHPHTFAPPVFSLIPCSRVRSSTVQANFQSM